MVNKQTKPRAVALADWADRFYRNVNDPEDFRWVHMKNSAEELRKLHECNELLSNENAKLWNWLKDAEQRLAVEIRRNKGASK